MVILNNLMINWIRHTRAKVKYKYYLMKCDHALYMSVSVLSIYDTPAILMFFTYKNG